MSTIPSASTTKPCGLTVRAIIADEAGRMLLVCRDPHSAHFAGEWEFPGGKVDAGEKLTDALRREVREEVGLEIALGGEAAATELELPHLHIRTLNFHARKTGGDLRLSNEHDQFRWMTPEELKHFPLTQATRDAFAEIAHHPCPAPTPPPRSPS